MSYEITGSRRIYDGTIIGVRIDEVRYPDGRRAGARSSSTSAAAIAETEDAQTLVGLMLLRERLH
ncbi:MAG: hypothetical protein ACR2NA_13715 [Solirubrobacterales bacterium]